jgi:hypothetical protein
MRVFYLCRSCDGITGHGAIWHGPLSAYAFSMLSPNESTWIVPGTITEEENTK